jgi:hypothetical protein
MCIYQSSLPKRPSGRHEIVLAQPCTLFWWSDSSHQGLEIRLKPADLIITIFAQSVESRGADGRVRVHPRISQCQLA